VRPRHRLAQVLWTRARRALRRAGLSAQIKYDVEGALSDYREAIKLDPANATVFANRGHIYRDAGDYDKALADFDQALALDQRQPDALASRGWILQQKGATAPSRTTSRRYRRGLPPS
jgi:tetratricopeptide (TPR) repeat protein